MGSLILSSWRIRGGAFAALLVALGECFSPLTAHVGYVSALVSAVSVSVIAAVVCAGIPARWRARSVTPSAGDALAMTGVYSVALVLVMFVVALVAGWIGHPCAPAHGAVFFALLALPAAVLAGFSGLALGAMTRRTWLATTLAALLVPFFVAWTAWRFYTTPAVFAYDPFFGFFPGALYDETIPLTPTLVTYRLGTLGAIIGLAGAIAAFWQRADSTVSLLLRVDLRTLPPDGGSNPPSENSAGGGTREGARDGGGRRVASLAAAVGGAFVALSVYLAGPTLGHRFDAKDIERVLGGRVDGPRCSVVYARSIAGRDARLMRDDCEVRLASIEAFFGVRVTSRVTVFLFADSAQKQQLMGAADTYIAKPWRHEVYLQYAPFPHPVLEHELAHVVAGEMSPGPFHVAARGRLLPLPGLIEGAAVAAGWEGDGDASPHQWSRAMLEAGLAPPLDVLTGLGFFLHASGTAYTAAGSFSRWLIDTRGAVRFRALYAGDSFERAYGSDLHSLERAWHAFLHTVPVPDRIMARARTRFRRRSVFARTCPHETAEMLDRATLRLAAGDVQGARRDLTTVVRDDPTDVAARTELAEAMVRAGNLAGAVALADEAQRDLGPSASTRLRARVGDVLWRWRGPEAARPLYATLDPEWFDEDDARTIEVKRWALGLGPVPVDPDYTRAVEDLLIGSADTDHDAVAMTARLALQFHTGPRGTPPDAMAGYLIGRQLLARDRYADAIAILSHIDPAGLISERVRRESVRIEAVSRFLAGDLEGARPLFERLASDPASPQGVRDVAADWLDRVRRTRP